MSDINITSLFKLTVVYVTLCLLILSTGYFVVQASVQDEISERQKQIEELQKQIEEYQSQIDITRGQSRTLENEIKQLNAKINQITLEIRGLELSVNKTKLEIGETEKKITESEDAINKHKSALVQYVNIAYQNDQKTITEILLNNDNISDFFNELNNLNATQDNLQLTIKDIRDLKVGLENHQNQLEEKRNELEQTKRLQELEQRSLNSSKTAQNNLLKETKGQESKYQNLVKQSQKDIEALRAQISYLIQNGVTAEEAVKFAQLAAIRTGIRPAYLLAELEQESALGSNVGKCYIVDSSSGATRRVTNGQIYAKGIHPTRDLPLFIKITAELGMDPFQTPISCGSSWGGAMGPAQFIPSTWVGYIDEVAKLTGHSLPNPWNVEDAFIAAAVKLSKDGASSQNRAGEVAASKRYYCGSATSTKSGCINYANSVQRLADEIEKNL